MKSKQRSPLDTEYDNKVEKVFCLFFPEHTTCGFAQTSSEYVSLTKYIHLCIAHLTTNKGFLQLLLEDCF